ncbi:ATP-binding protein [Salinactinospora qingdaonensis]|uniref:Histidine kinase/HSP90-like ATPase domain-containing protein n=1 Tax=Salinactinospora qingdaonensis TaxID=702744 RepID=A0ABP7FV42_9ACTN
MPALAPMPPLPEVTVALDALVPPLYRHYFNRRPDRPYYLYRRYDFPGLTTFLPLVRAFLDTCAAERGGEYRYLFALLGTELASNAIAHTHSGRPGGNYSLVVRRSQAGLTLTCRDDGTDDPPASESRLRAGSLAAFTDPQPDSRSGTGLALVDALSSSWGDSGPGGFRRVWFHLAYDLSGSAWRDA